MTSWLNAAEKPTVGFSMNVVPGSFPFWRLRWLRFMELQGVVPFKFQQTFQEIEKCGASHGLAEPSTEKLEIWIWNISDHFWPSGPHIKEPRAPLPLQKSAEVRMKRSLNEGNSKRMSKLECIVTTNFEMLGQATMRLEVLPLLVHGMQECGNGQEMQWNGKVLLSFWATRSELKSGAGFFRIDSSWPLKVVDLRHV